MNYKFKITKSVGYRLGTKHKRNFVNIFEEYICNFRRLDVMLQTIYVAELYYYQSIRYKCQ